MTAACSWDGEIYCRKEDLDLDLTLLGGQSFRWKKKNRSWVGVAFDCFWIISQTTDSLKFKVYCAKYEKIEYFTELLVRYFRIDFDLSSNFKKWCGVHNHFEETSKTIKAVRILDQEPIENIISFMCSQNNNIKRITSMIEWFCLRFGQLICRIDGDSHYAFPTLNSLLQNQKKLEENLREAKFGYRAKFISQAVKKINEVGGLEWFEKLRKSTYSEARIELIALPGIGPKVADCICLMSLNHLDAVPVDTHIFKIAQQSYLPHLKGVRSITPKIYDEIANHFRSVYGVNAGWAQAVLFCSDLKMFQQNEIKKAEKRVKKMKNVK